MAPEIRMITKQRLDELYEYIPSAGEFVRRIGTGGCAAGSIAGYTNQQGYVVMAIDGKEYRRSRLVWLHMTGEMPAQQIDHINRNRSDDRFQNLRQVTHQQNQWNTCKCDGEHKNIYWKSKAKKYEVQVSNKYIGRFSDYQSALVAAQEARANRAFG